MMGFTFKQFFIEDDLCAMKVGTDAVLLGAWTDVHGAEKILDIGTGCGIIALMLAQRSKATITAIEIEPKASRQAAMNFTSSPWKDRLKLQCIPLREFAEGDDTAFDLIVSNPPYFTDSLRSFLPERNLARHNESIDLHLLLHASYGLLHESGRCSFIIPSAEEKRLSDHAVLNNFHLVRKTSVIAREGKPPGRSLLEFSKQRPQKAVAEFMTVRDAHGNYTDTFRDLTKDFYLHF